MIAARDLSTGSVVAWDGEFRFWSDSPPTISDPTNVKAASAVGAAFSLGVLLPCLAIRLDEDGNTEVQAVMGLEELQSFGEYQGGINPGQTVVVYGPGVDNPEYVSKLGRLCPLARMLVSPLNEGTLSAIGVIAATVMKDGRDAPRKVPLDENFDKELSVAGIDLDVKLGTDGLWMMTSLMKEGMCVCNQTMRRRGVSPFHGRVLSMMGWWSKPVFLMRSEAVNDYFPAEPLALKMYAACDVPVRVKTTELFKKETLWKADEVDIFVASEGTQCLTTMLNLVHMSSGRRWIASADPKDVPVPKVIPVFRHNRAYNVDGANWNNMVLQ